MDKERSIKAPIISEEPPRYGAIQSPPSPTGSNPEEEYKAYPARFYILAVFSVFSVVQSLAWLTFGTIPNESHQYFGLTDDDITLLAGMYNVLLKGVYKINYDYAWLLAPPYYYLEL